MTYELAKKLKEKGFPQTRILQEVIIRDDGLPLIVDMGINENDYKVPSLEELIEACLPFGTNFTLRHDNAKHNVNFEYTVTPWAALIHGFLSNPGVKYGKGDTTVEAVANLWLKLHE